MALGRGRAAAAAASVDASITAEGRPSATAQRNGRWSWVPHRRGLVVAFAAQQWPPSPLRATAAQRHLGAMPQPSARPVSVTRATHVRGHRASTLHARVSVEGFGHQAQQGGMEGGRLEGKAAHRGWWPRSRSRCLPQREGGGLPGQPEQHCALFVLTTHGILS